MHNATVCIYVTAVSFIPLDPGTNTEIRLVNRRNRDSYVKNSLKAKSRCVYSTNRRTNERTKGIRLVCTEERTSEWVQFGAQH